MNPFLTSLSLGWLAAQIGSRSADGLWWLPLAAYLLGSIPFGYLIVKLSGGGDIRFRGSGNIGATNVAREAGTLPGVATLILDAAKGYFSVWLAARVSHGNLRWMMLAAVLAIARTHLPGLAALPRRTRRRHWRGSVPADLLAGRGRRADRVDPGAGVLALRFAGFHLRGGFSSPSWCTCSMRRATRRPYPVSAGASFAMVLVIVRHRANIIRLLRGTEPQFTFRRNARSHEP